MMNGNEEAIDVTPELAPNVGALVVAQQQQHDLVVSRPPEVVLEEARRAAVSLKNVLDSKPKKVEFGGKRYLEIDDWTLLGRFYGITARIVETKPVEYNGVRGWEAVAGAVGVSDGTSLSRVESMCLSDEPNWRNKPQMQLRSMAQTRACSRALATVLRWVPVLAGYAGTPAEEMDSVIARGAKKLTPQQKRAEMVSRIQTMEQLLSQDIVEAVATECGIGDLREATEPDLATYGKALKAKLDAIETGD